jgi:exosortase C (VPDSG-CTERM-specific)
MPNNVQATSGWEQIPRRQRWFPLVLLVVALCFSKALYELVVFAFSDSLYSHIVLIPFISGYLVWLQKDKLAGAFEPAARMAAVPIVVGCGALVGYWVAQGSGWHLPPEDLLALTTLSFVSFVAAACALFLGRDTLAAVSFPLAFLLFMVPFPSAVRSGLETFFQYTSANTASIMFGVVGAPLYLDGLIFHLFHPRMNIEVAPVCSGIHSSLVLFMTSLLAGNMMLTSRWKRAWLALLVIPLAILRNAFRIFSICELCIHFGPQMIDSPIHHRGGPIFFALSLVPFFLLLYYFIKLERRSPATPGAQPKALP